MSVGSQFPGKGPEVWREASDAAHQVDPQRLTNEARLRDIGRSGRVAPWVWALVAVIALGLVVVFLS